MLSNENVQHGSQEDDGLDLAVVGLGQQPKEPNALVDQFSPMPCDSLSFENQCLADYALSFPYREVAALPESRLFESAPMPECVDYPRSSRGKRAHFSQRATEILGQWLERRFDDPYPTKGEKVTLAEETGLSVAQVSTWFANARRRRKRRVSVGNGESCPDLAESICESNVVAPEDWPSLSPLERWENSPPEIEPAPLEAILHAVTSEETRGQVDGDYDSLCSHTRNKQQYGSSGVHDARSVVSSNASGSGLSATSGSSTCSFASSRSGGSFSRFYVNEPPRRRRRRKQLRGAKSERRPFQCTFCTDTFRTKHDWTRHEKTLHLSLEKFTCAPFGPIYCCPEDETEHCVFCDEPFPSATHVECHQFSSCQQKPLGFRTFYRKDHLFQHLRLIHGVRCMNSVMDTWRSRMEHVNSRCGFCDERFTLWSERNDHIAQHFRNGALMKDWRGCRGLDPPVALAVENAMPPYLIGMESTGMDPFRASFSVESHGPGEPDNGIVSRTNPTPFEHLTVQLSYFVQRVRASGDIVTDEMLQKEARCILYCDDDPWNQTPADNSEWLRLFKQGVGLGMASGPVQTGHSPSSTGGENEFCLPWSAEQWTPFYRNAGVVTSDPSDPSDMVNTCMTWSWQSPECLVEYRRYLETLPLS